MMDALTEAVRNLHATRQSKADLDDQVRALRAAFDAEHAELLASQKMLTDQVSEQEAQVKALGMVAYESSLSTSPVAGVTVKLFKTMAYDPKAALAWAKEKKMALVPEALDVKAFDKIAAATPLDFVTYDSEPRVQIATDLAKALAAVPAPVPAEVG